MSQQILFRNFELLEPSFGELRGGYQLLVEGDTIKGKIAFDRNGEPQSLDWNASREVAKPAEPAAKPARKTTRR